MNDRVIGTSYWVEGSFDQFVATLNKHLNGDVVGNVIVVDQLSNEIEIRLTCSRKPNFDLLESHLHQFLKHPKFSGRVHGIDEGLIAVS